MSELHSNNLDLQSSIEKENNLEFRLDNIEKSYSRFWIGFSEFSNYIIWLEKNAREDILWVFEDLINKKSIIRYLKIDWNPFPTSETISFFKQEFLEEKYKIKKLNEIETESIIYNEYLEETDLLVSKFLDIKNILSKYDDDKIKDFIGLISVDENSTIEDKEIFKEKITDYLTPDKVSHIVKYLIQKEWVDSEIYKSFRSTLIDIDPSFEKSFVELERAKNIEINSSWDITDLEKVYISSSLYNWLPKRQWDFLISGDIKMDLWEVPPLRYLQLEWSNYSLKTKPSLWDFSEHVIDYERKMNEVRPKVEENSNIVNSFEWSMNNLNSLDFSNPSDLQSAFWEIDKLNLFLDKNIFKSKIEQLSDKNPIDKSEADNLKSDILSALKTSLLPHMEVKKTLEKEVADIKTEYQQSLNQAKAEYIRKLKEKDEKTRDTLRFLSSIWFDEIPQSVTDMIIETLNSSSTLANSLWFTTKINLEEGLLWTDTNMDNKKDSLWEKVKFAKFVNILISWSEDIPLNINNLKADSWVAIDDITLFRASLQESWLLDTMTWYGTAMTRLKSHQIMPTTKSTTQENPES